MKARLTGTQWDLVMVVIRKTWGWHKKQDYIPHSQFEKLTGRHRNSITRELSVLQNRNILKQTQRPTPSQTAKWKFNKDWESWESPPKVTPYKVPVTAEGDTSEGAKGVTADATLQKKGKRNKYTASSDADPRFNPLKEFFHTYYKKVRGTKLVTDGSDFKALSELLKKVPDIPLKRLEAAAISYLNSSDDFDQKQGHPLRYWANNINPWLAGPKQRKDDLQEFN